MKSIARFLRFEYLAFALMLTQIGAASVTTALPRSVVLGLLAASSAFHVYICLLNDLIDLPLDRTNPGRKNYPLVKGTIQPWQAWLMTLAMLPLIVWITLGLGGSAVSFAAMAVTLGMMTIYDVWGKRTRVPLLIDLVQGIGFAAMVVFGAGAVGAVNVSTWLLFAWVVVYMMLANFLGGLRDIQEDRQFGAYTTPISFGITLDETGFTFARRDARYAGALQVAMVVLALAIALQNGPGYGPLGQTVLVVVLLVLGLVAVVLHLALFEVARRDPRGVKRIGPLQLAVSVSLVLVPLFGCTHGWLFALVCAAFYAPSGKLVLRWLRARAGA
jgi:4-hydroxybenzoate polyprenyltransferase